MKVLPLYTTEELQHIEWFRQATPCQPQEMLEVYRAILRGVKDEEIRELCKRLLRAMRGERNV